MIKKILIGGFWALVLLPNLLFMLAGGKGDGGGTENRTLAEFPVFETDTYETFPSAVDSYINDHAAFRNRFLSANSVLNLKLFGYADNQDVIRGKDGWYFFAGGMSLYDALGTEPFYPDDVAWIGNQIIRAADYYESRGIPFIVMIPPNKEGVYREYMPDCYGRVWEGNRPAQLEEYLREHSGITVLDPREYFNANRDYTWYYKTCLLYTSFPEEDMNAYRNILLGKWKKETRGWKYEYQDEVLTNWALINEKWYYFGADGYMKTGWQDYKGDVYYLSLIHI